MNDAIMTWPGCRLDENESGGGGSARNWKERASAAGREFGNKDFAGGVFDDTPPAVLPSLYWPEFKLAYRAVNTHPCND